MALSNPFLNQLGGYNSGQQDMIEHYRKEMTRRMQEAALGGLGVKQAATEHVQYEKKSTARKKALLLLTC